MTTRVRSKWDMSKAAVEVPLISKRMSMKEIGWLIIVVQVLSFNVNYIGKGFNENVFD